MATTTTDRLGVTPSTGSTTVPAYGFTGLGVLASADEEAIASAATTDVLGSDALFNRITGTTTITSLGSATNRLKFVRFTGALTLTHNATSLILPGASNITTAGGDTMVVISDDSGNARVIVYQSASGTATLGGSETLTNKTLTSPVINTSISGSAFLDEDDMSSNAADKVASQQSIRAYADSVSPVGKQTIWVPAAAMTPATTSGAVSGQVEETTNKHNYTTLDFDASADEYACFEILMPKGWNESTITFQAVWSSTAADTDGVSWGLQAVAVADGDDSDVAYGTGVVVDDANQSTAGDVLVSAESGAVTVAGSPAAGELTMFRVYRDVSDANDTATEDAQLRGVSIFYTIDAAEDT